MRVWYGHTTNRKCAAQLLLTVEQVEGWRAEEQSVPLDYLHFGLQANCKSVKSEAIMRLKTYGAAASNQLLNRDGFGRSAMVGAFLSSMDWRVTVSPARSPLLSRRGHIC